MESVVTKTESVHTKNDLVVTKTESMMTKLISCHKIAKSCTATVLIITSSYGA